jgi:hypothetical protein
MTLWAWIGVGISGLVALSLVASLAIARILGTISEEITELLDAEPWASAPLKRETDGLAEVLPIGVRAYRGGRRSRSRQRSLERRP